MPTVQDALTHCRWLIEKGRGEEKAVLYLPRVEAQRRKVNKDQHRRVVFVTEPEVYAEWHGQRDRFTELCGGNPQFAYRVMLKILGAVSEAAIQGLYEEGL